MISRLSTQRRTTHRKDSNAGFTLVELLIGLASSSLLVAGLASAIYISSQALDLDSSTSRQSAIASEVLVELTADLVLARSFSERTAAAVTFDVPDRDGDLDPETIRYAWSGTTGDPLTYRYNGGTVITIAKNVQSFDLTALTRLIIAPEIIATIPIGVVYEEFTEKKASTNATSLLIDLPPGTGAGDLLIACVATDGNEAASLTAQAGWNIVDVGTQGNTVTFGVWWKLATAAESSTQLFSWASGQKGWGFIMRFTGHDPIDPIQTTALAVGTAISPTSPAVTTTVDNAMILRLGGFRGKSITVGDTGLVDHTTITMDRSGSTGGNASAGAGYATLTTAGDSGSASFSLTMSRQYRTVTIAIAPNESP